MMGVNGDYGSGEPDMKAIYKYRLPFMEVSKVTMPADSEIIRTAGLDGAIWLWAIVDTEKPLVERTFHLFKTGGKMPDDIADYNFLGCGAIFIQMELMMYIFEKPNTEVPVGDIPPPFDWKLVQEKNHAI
jgi:hypothetical protein